MGNSIDQCLPKGWNTTLSDIQPESGKDAFSNLSLRDVHDAATEFAESTDSNGDTSAMQVFTKCGFSAYLSTVKCAATSIPFSQFCSRVIKAVLEYGKNMVSSTSKVLSDAIQHIIKSLVDRASNPIVRKVLYDISEKALSDSATKDTVCGLTKATAASVAEESLSTLTKAKQSAKSALKWGIAVDGVVLAYTCCKSYSKYKDGAVTWEQHRRTVIKRTGGATGSVGGGAIGSFVGTMIFPGVGSLVGGFVGGVAGDYLGSFVGGKVDESL